MKRVKKGFRMELPRDADITIGVVVGECNGWLRLEQPGAKDNAFDMVDLSAAQCEAIGMTAVLEDVPTPGQRLVDALREAGLGLHVSDTGDVLRGQDECVERVAAVLGIKPEGES